MYIMIYDSISVYRLEAGMCLHGADISTKTTPVEAALMWTISINNIICIIHKCIFLPFVYCLSSQYCRV